MSESVELAVQQQFSQQSCLSESSCLASRVSHEYSGEFPEGVTKGIKEHQGESMNQGGPFLGSSVKKEKISNLSLLCIE